MVDDTTEYTSLIFTREREKANIQKFPKLNFQNLSNKSLYVLKEKQPSRH